LRSPVANLLQIDGSSSRRSRIAKRPAADSSRSTALLVSWHDLLIGDVVGTGQFGLVRLTKHKVTADAYALKVCIYLYNQSSKKRPASMNNYFPPSTERSAVMSDEVTKSRP
jgi:hypothetical protein